MQAALLTTGHQKLVVNSSGFATFYLTVCGKTSFIADPLCPINRSYYDRSIHFHFKKNW